MVEFGLKLEDNKVQRWSENYLEYEKLKAALKKAQDALKTRNEFKEKYPAILEFYNVSLSRSSIGSTDVSVNVSNFEDRGGNENEALLSNKVNSYNSMKDGKSVDPEANTVFMKPTLSDASISLLSVFSGGATSNPDNIKTRYRDMSSKFLSKHASFVQSIKIELNKIDQFYVEQINDITQRFEYLDGNVADLAKEFYSLRGSSDQRLEQEPNMKKAGTDSLTEVERENLKHLWRKQAMKKIKPKRSKVINMLGLVHEVSESDGEDGTDDMEMKNKADSIKRSITDLYRTSKLLKNYANLNYTGFVK